MCPLLGHNGLIFRIKVIKPFKMPSKSAIFGFEGVVEKIKIYITVMVSEWKQKKEGFCDPPRPIDHINHRQRRELR